jgi:hypothetical protein
MEGVDAHHRVNACRFNGIDDVALALEAIV